MVSATILPPRKTWMLGCLATVAATGLAVFHWPLPWHGGGKPEFPALYVASVWAALLLSLSFMGVYAFRVADEARKLAEALAATELVLAREYHLNALDGLAAAAAHELGTPLATIALVAKELEREVPADSEWGDDIQLLRSQSDRCRTILAKLRSLAGESDEHFARMSLSELIEEVADPHRNFGVDIQIRIAGEIGKAPIGKRNPAILYGLGNIVENAVDFAAGIVSITARWDDESVTIAVTDDGPGFAPDVIDRIGEPYISTRVRGGRRDPEAPDGVGGGLGLGVFIAKTFLVRSGATVTIANRRGPDHGASVTIVWPRVAFEIVDAIPA